ncbi:MFS transporter [Amycolatopsis rubida]|uniref:MFS transporter n=1 Tax=Amycolatopsis rubida TaxID=112413 RepID=A0ABX0BZM6_9PSEU|nr:MULTISPECIES: MFS transporter [Amycolatopsis]MYW93268.1 MFS transporter [Amycolatopsis rubida]NEC58255.1 MFS transporter [Amycolatopsis rubida]OAP20020.1 enterobactin exporter EntS [Amycolatopsis sp. M39]
MAGWGGSGSAWVRLQAVAVSGSTCEGLLLAALPLLAVSITTDPRAVSLVNVAGQAPWLLLSLFAGVVIDRVRRTAVLASAYAVQIAAALTLALLGSTGSLSLPALLVVAFVLTTAQVFGDGAAGSVVPEVVTPDQLTMANSRLQVIDRGMVQFVVPPATGLLIGIGAGLPAWLAAVAALVALLLARGIPSAKPVRTPAHPLKDVTAGLRYLVGTPLLRSITVAVALGSFAAAAGNSMLVLYATQELRLAPFGYGVLLACLAVGWVVSSFFVDRFVRRFGYSTAMRIAQACAVLSQLLIAIVPPWPVLVGAVLIFLTATTLVWNVCSQSSRQRFTPPELLGRVLTSHRALAWGLTPLGALAGGFAAVHWSLRGVWVMAAAVQLLGTSLVWRRLSPAAFREAAAAMAR